MGPDSRENSLQFVPNSKAITMPETTPSPKAMPKILSQNSKRMRYAGRPVARYSASRTVSHAASPIVNDGKMMWKETVKANCSRDSSNAERSIVRAYRTRVALTARCRGPRRKPQRRAPPKFCETHLAIGNAAIYCALVVED